MRWIKVARYRHDLIHIGACGRLTSGRCPGATCEVFKRKRTSTQNLVTPTAAESHNPCAFGLH